MPHVKWPTDWRDKMKQRLLDSGKRETFQNLRMCQCASDAGENPIIARFDREFLYATA